MSLRFNPSLAVPAAIYTYAKPSLPATVKAWWDCSLLPSDLTGVTQLPDQGAGGWHLTFGASAPAIHVATDGRKALDFTATVTNLLTTVQVGGLHFFAAEASAGNWAMILVMSSASLSSNTGTLMGTDFSTRNIKAPGSNALQYSENADFVSASNCWYNGLDNRAVVAAHQMGSTGTIEYGSVAPSWTTENMIPGTMLGKSAGITLATTHVPTAAMRINEAKHGMRLWGALYLDGLTDQDLKDAIGWAHNRWTLPTGDTPVVLFQGDSTSRGAWAETVLGAAMPGAFGQAHGKGGRKAADLLTSTGYSDVYPVVAKQLSYAGRPVIYPMLIGTNDIDTATGTPAQIITNVEAWATAVRAYGSNVFPVWMQCSINHRGSDGTGHNLVSTSMRDAVVAGTSAFSATIDTLENDAIWGWTRDVTNVTEPLYMTDQSHPNATGNADIAAKWGPAFASLAEAPATPPAAASLLISAPGGVLLLSA